MGATALLIAALKDPKHFRALILYEPIIFPPHLVKPYSSDMEDSPLAILARKRRNLFTSFPDAYDNFVSKLPFSAFDPEVVRDYVNNGLVPCSDKDTDNVLHGEQERERWCMDAATSAAEVDLCLRCSPTFEAFVYNSASDYYIYDRLSSLANIPIVVMSGNIYIMFSVCFMYCTQ